MGALAALMQLVALGVGAGIVGYETTPLWGVATALLGWAVMPAHSD